jgi:uncharacterized protein (TIGR01777 family)
MNRPVTQRTVAISGASGLVGSALAEALEARGDRVLRLVRAEADAGEGRVYFGVEDRVIDGAALEGVDAVVHLAGESIGGKRWTAAQKERIRASRVDGTKLLAGALALLSKKPRVLACASAVGIYGDRGDEELDETSAPGEGFLVEVCRLWEEAADPARNAGIRVAHVRLGLVLSPEGGALARMLPIFRTGLGGKLGDGKQWWSFISLEDVVRAFLHVIDRDDLEGPINAVSPEPLTNADFTRTLARALHRPAPFPVPAAALYLAMGRDMTREALLSSQRVLPRRLLATDFTYHHPTLGTVLNFQL